MEVRSVSRSEAEQIKRRLLPLPHELSVRHKVVLPPGGIGIKSRATAGNAERRAIAEEAAVAIKKKYSHPIHLITFNLGGSRAMCGARGCVRSCLAHLDQADKLCRKFDQPFRPKGCKPQPMDTFRSASSNARCQFSDDD